MAQHSALYLDPNPLTMHAMKRRFFVYAFDRERKAFLLGGPVQQIVVSESLLSIDGLEIASARFGTESVGWSQEGGGHYCAGQLFVSRGGLELYGSISTGASGKTAVLTHVFASAVPPTSYRTEISTVRVAEGTKPESLAPGQWKSGSELTLGYVPPAGDLLPSLTVTLGGQDYGNEFFPAVTDTDLAQLNVTAINDASVICAVDDSLYLAGTITFSTFGDTFSGTISATCADQSGKGNYLWKGVATNGAVLAKPALPSAQSLNSAISPPDGLSLGDLLRLIPDDGVRQMADAMLVENMKWAISKSDTQRDWLPQFFGQNAPAISADRVSAINTDLNWYQTDFAPAYLTWGLDTLTGPMAPTVKLSEPQKQKLQNYLQTGMAKSTPYARQMQSLYSSAYAAMPRFQNYIDDKQSNWAQQVFDFVTSPPQLLTIVNRAFTSHDVSASNSFAAMLHTLDPSGEFAVKYQRMFLSRVLLHASLSAVVKDRDTAMAWIPQAIDAFLKLNQPSATRGTEATAADNETDAQRVARLLLEIARGIGGLSNLTTAILNILLLVKGSSVAEQGQNAADAFTKQFPDGAEAANFMFYLAWVGGIFQVIVSFVKFDDLTSVQKAQAINQSVALANRAAGQVVGYFKGKFTAERINEVNLEMAEPEVLQEFENIGTELAADGGPAQDWMNQGLGNLMRSAGAGGFSTEGTSWEKFFTRASKVVAVIAVATSAVVAVLATINLVNDVNSGKPVSQQALDGIIMVAAYGQFLFQAGVLIAETVARAVAGLICGIAASVFALIGFVAMLIELFLPSPPVNQPVNDFMEKTGIPFVDGLPALA